MTTPKASASTRQPHRAPMTPSGMPSEDRGQREHGRLGGHGHPHLAVGEPEDTAHGELAPAPPHRHDERVGEGDPGERGGDQGEQDREIGHSLRVEEAVRHRERVDQAREQVADLRQGPIPIRAVGDRDPEDRGLEGARLDAVHPRRRDDRAVADVRFRPVGDHGHADDLEGPARAIAQRLQRHAVTDPAPARSIVRVPRAISSSDAGARPSTITGSETGTPSIGKRACTQTIGSLLMATSVPPMRAAWSTPSTSASAVGSGSPSLADCATASQGAPKRWGSSVTRRRLAVPPAAVTMAATAMAEAATADTSGRVAPLRTLCHARPSPVARLGDEAPNGAGDGDRGGRPGRP